ncbi:MAG: signal peptidase II [Caldilineaceae bacterium]|nr:signal peptidase II [Caldilineaceae bacterium]
MSIGATTVTPSNVRQAACAGLDALPWLRAYRLMECLNAGGFLGLGATLPMQWRVGLFSVSVLILLLMLLSYALFAKAVSAPMLLGFALLLAGGVGNLADRLLYDGVVVDFIHIGIGPVRTGIFNVADIAVSAGVRILSVVMLQSSSKASQTDVEPEMPKERGTG